MWARLRLGSRRAAWAAAWAVGTPAVSAPLLVLAAAYLAAGALGWAEGSQASSGLPDAWPYRVLAAALVLDAGVGFLRGAPVVQRPDGGLALAPLDRRSAGGALLRAGYLLVALAFVASLLSRDRLEFRCAAGEEFTASPEQLAGRDAPRPMAPGPFALRLPIESVRGGEADAAGGPVRVAARDERGRERHASAWRPLWYGWGRFVRPTATGHAVGYELAREGGAALEEGIVKLDLLPRGRVDSIRPSAAPYRVYVRLAAGEGGAPAFEAAVYRGKLRVAAGPLADDAPLRFEGLLLRATGWRPWVRLEQVRDPGVPLAAFGVAAMLLGLALRGLRPPGAPREAADG